jgi:thioredoxin-dependent peroxiredoxin
MAIKVGDKCPEFTLQNQDGEEVSIGSLIGQKILVIYFYPKDNTAGCTAQACSFRDAYQDLIDIGSEVIGISSDKEETHALFADKHRLPYPLLSDSKGIVRKLFGVPTNLFGVIPGRVTYVVDKHGMIRKIINSQLNIQSHVNGAKEMVLKLTK